MIGFRLFVAASFDKFAGIFKWRQAVVGRAKAKKQVRTRIGRVIHVVDDVTDNSLFNWYVQANGAGGVQVALCLISCGLEGIDARIVHTQHYEIIVEARDAIEDQVQAIVKESMEEALERVIPEVPFVAETRVAEAWGLGIRSFEQSYHPKLPSSVCWAFFLADFDWDIV